MKIAELQSKYCKILEDNLRSEPANCSLDQQLDRLQRTIYSSAIDTFGLICRQQPDWYKETLDVIQLVLDEKREALTMIKSSPSEKSTGKYLMARASAQRTVRKCMKDYWDRLCSPIESAHDMGNIKNI